MPITPKPASLVPASPRRGMLAVAAGILMCAILLTSVEVPATATPTKEPRPRAARAGGNPLVIVWLENKQAKQITGANAPFLTSLKRRGRYFTNYNAISDPSLPNYLAVASGSTRGKSGTDSIRAGEIPGPTVWRQLSNARVSWGVFQESMPNTCYAGSQMQNRRTGPYVLRHNPATPFADIVHSKACRHVKPLGAMPKRLPQVSFVTPAICNDMHGVGDSSLGASCRAGTTALIRRGDAWVHHRMRKWRRAGATVVITFDEGSGPLYAMVVGHGVRRAVDHRRYSHYSLLAAVERRFHLPRLGGARSARPLPIGH